MATGVTGELMQQLLRDDADLVLVHEPPASEQLKTIISVRQPLCAMVRPDHPLADRVSVRIADCHKYLVALADRSPAHTRMVLVSRNGRALTVASLAVAHVIEQSLAQLRTECTWLDASVNA